VPMLLEWNPTEGARAMLLLIGPDDALLEGLAQLLAGAGHGVRAARSMDDAMEQARQSAPLLIVLDRGSVVSDHGEAAARIPLAPGGAFVLYRATSDQGGTLALAHAIARQTLADLSLPLERQRLVALAQYVKARAREVRRVRFDTPPERRAPA
jgi:CheY-like chemotaxis protein